MKIKLSVGTTSNQKIGYLKELLKEIGVEAEIFPFNVESGVSEQPMTLEETKAGSVNRAKKAFEKDKSVDCAIGIEVGYHPVENNKHEIFCWVTIVDSSGFVVSEKSRGFILPKFYQKIMDDGLYLGDYVKEYPKNDKNSVVQYVMETLTSRKLFIVDALMHALLFYFAKEEF